MKREKKIVLLASLSIIVVLIVFSIAKSPFFGKSTPPQNPAIDIDISYPFPISLKYLLKDPKVGEYISIKVTMESIVDIDDVNSTITISKGFELIEGEIEWNNDLKEGIPIEKIFLLKAVEHGGWEIKVISMAKRVKTIDGGSGIIYIDVN